MDKSSVLKAYLGFLDKKIGDEEKSLALTRKAVNGALVHEESRTDTLKNIANIADRLTFLERVRDVAASIPSDRLDCPDVGALVVIEDSATRKKEYYFIVPEHGGDSLFLENLEVTPLSIGTPLFKAISKGKVGDTFEFRGRKLKLAFVA